MNLPRREQLFARAMLETVAFSREWILGLQELQELGPYIIFTIHRSHSVTGRLSQSE